MIAAQIDDRDVVVISNLINGLDVLQVGCWQGHDTAALARSAARTVTIGQRPGLDHTGFRDQLSMWSVIQRFYSVADRTLILPGTVPELVSSFTAGQFDVAVIDMTALGVPDPGQIITLIRMVANKVIIIPAGFQQMAAYAEGMAEIGYTVEQCGRVWVFDPAPVPAGAETESGS